MKTNWTFLLLPFACLVVACAAGPKDADKIADAQSCLDTATPSEVAGCVQKVDGIESEAAYLIRCAGKFVKEGFSTGTKLSTALSNISGGNTGSTGSTAMMAALAFQAESSSALNSASAQEALDYCTKSKSKGMILLSGLTQTASVLGDLGLGTTTITGNDLKNLMGTLQNNPVAQSAVGSAVVSIYSTNCTNSSTTTGNYCQQFESAVSTVAGGLTNTTEIGKQIMICYNNPSATGCTGF